MPCNICFCGAAAGYMHAADCPFPLVTTDPERAATWLAAREELRALYIWYDGELARLKNMVGREVWYYDCDAATWGRMVVLFFGVQDGDPAAWGSLGRVGYGWQFADGADPPALPDLSKTYP